MKKTKNTIDELREKEKHYNILQNEKQLAE